MDDLAGLDWSASASQSGSQSNTKSPPTNNANYFPTLKPTPPVSGRSTPALLPQPNGPVRPPSTSSVPSKSSTPQNDSFANLLPFTSIQSTRNVSLQEQQRLLQEQRERQELERRKKWSSQFGGTIHTTSVEADSGKMATDRILSPPTYAATSEYGGQRLSTTVNKPFAAIKSTTGSTSIRKPSEEEDDILAAFSSTAPVDASTNFPVPSDSRSSSRGLPTVQRSSITNTVDTVEDDDPFGLGTTPIGHTVAGSQPSQTVQEDDDDDVLGLLGKPVSALPPKSLGSTTPDATVHPLDQEIAELMDMGFSAEKSKEALLATGTDPDVQAAVGWLLNQAHTESRSKSQTPATRGRGQHTEASPSRTEIDLSSKNDPNQAMPAWMRQQSRSTSSRRPESNRSASQVEKDPAKYAAELGNNLFKTANSLWKTGAKKLNKAVAEFNSEADSSEPKWMRDTQNSYQQDVPVTKQQSSRRSGNTKSPTPAPEASTAAVLDMTDEAMMLESGSGRPRPRQKQSSKVENPAIPKAGMPVNHSRKPETSPIQPRFMQQSSSSQVRQKLSRHTTEEENSQAYISPARRKKAAPKSPSTEPDLLFNGIQGEARSAPLAQPKKQTPSQNPSKKPVQNFGATPRASTPIISRPKPPPRTIPPLSSIALQSSTSHRLAGTASFKLGSYADATASYTSSLRDLPPQHPLTIVLLTNRALTYLKTGDPKACIVDADAAISLIGPSRGAGESINIGSDEGTKDMASFWGKAMMRRAEALEQLERWSDAGKVWTECVEAGVGGSTSIQGRNRCEKVTGGGTVSSRLAAPRRPTPATKKPTPRPVPRNSALDNLSGRPSPMHASSAEAVTRLRAANAEAERVDDEKFALADAVDDRLSRWRKGKETNLRALLGSLDTVLWEGAGWKKVGMSELIVPGRVKVAYMKGIAKVHPDKVCFILSYLLVLVLMLELATDDRYNGTGHDQWSCLQHAQRGLGQIQEGEWALGGDLVCNGWGWTLWACYYDNSQDSSEPCIDHRA